MNPQKPLLLNESQVLQPSALGKASWIANLSKKTRKVVEWVMALLAIGFFCCQTYLTRRSVLLAILADTSPVRFEQLWTPDKEVYAPGETIRLTYQRNSTFDPKEGPLLVLSLDAFENKTNGEVYAGDIIGRVIQEPGLVTRTSVSHIPVDASDGEYIFEGWMRAETPRRTLPRGYQSKPFYVKRN